MQIIEIGDIAWQGRTEPVFCKAEDGYEYVVKGNFAGKRALIAEWTAGRLGRLLDLPIPEFRMLELAPLLFDYGMKREALDRLGRGTLFGSRRVANLVEIREADLAEVDPLLQARVLAFDWWIMNADRIFIDGAGNPNLLWSEQEKKLTVIDHNLAFDPSLMDDFWREHAFRAVFSSWDDHFRQKMGDQFRFALKELPTIWRELPEDWISAETGLTMDYLESLLWQFNREPAMFWRLS